MHHFKKVRIQLLTLQLVDQAVVMFPQPLLLEMLPVQVIAVHLMKPLLHPVQKFQERLELVRERVTQLLMQNQVVQVV